MDASREEVLAAVESLASPSPPEEIADAIRVRARPRLTEFDGAGPCVAAETVLGLLRELKESGQVKGYARGAWVSLGVDLGQTAHPAGLLWWPVARWREAAARRARRDQAERLRAEARQEEERARRESPLRDAVERTLEQRRWDAKHPYEGLDPM
ncbi:hypothetical protein AB0P10_08120 [Streptomyces parvus]|uniref:hypothetical protein n=1 Tax=Streptomyces parvus TaxID=66428 RepID=UPI0034279FFC